MTRAGLLVAAAISVMLIELVLVARIFESPKRLSSSEKIDFFTSAFSTTASNGRKPGRATSRGVAITK
jgi:hypothetical protein